MTSAAPLEAARIELANFANSAEALGLTETRAIFLIGSLPGGYFRPGQSDLDVLVIFQGAPSSENTFTAAQLTEKERLQALAVQAAPYEIELLFLHETRLRRDPLTGLFPYADFAQRLISQSELLWGEPDLKRLEAPTKQDFACAFKRYLEYLQDKQGEDFFTRGAVPELLKHALVLMRYYLLVQRGVLEYDKTQLARRYQDNQPPLPLPSAIARALDAQFAGKPISARLSKSVRAALPDFHAALSREILRLPAHDADARS